MTYSPLTSYFFYKELYFEIQLIQVKYYLNLYHMETCTLLKLLYKPAYLPFHLEVAMWQNSGPWGRLKMLRRQLSWVKVKVFVKENIFLPFTLLQEYEYDACLKIQGSCGDQEEAGTGTSPRADDVRSRRQRAWFQMAPLTGWTSPGLFLSLVWDNKAPLFKSG